MLELVYTFCEFLADVSRIDNETSQKTCINLYLFAYLPFILRKTCRKSWKTAIFSSNFVKLLHTQTPNRPLKYAFKRRAAAYYNRANTSVILVISQAGFSVMPLHHLYFFTTTWLPRFQFLWVFFAISFNSLPNVCENSRNMLEQTVY